MKRKILLIFLLSCFYGPVSPTKSNMRIIRANSEKVDIREGNIYEKGCWRIRPEYKPNIYFTRYAFPGDTVTLYTDLDSISFRMKAFQNYDFIVLFQGRDSIRVQIKSMPKYINTLKSERNHKYACNPYLLLYYI